MVEQLRTGPAARLVMVAIAGGSPQARAHVSAQLAQSLRADSAIAAVADGDAAGFDRDRELLFRDRYLLSAAVTPERFTVHGLHAAISDSIDGLASPDGLLLKPLFAEDPTGEMLGIVDGLADGQAPRTRDGVWVSADGERALLVVQLRAAGSDTDAQEQACNLIRSSFDAALADAGSAAHGVTMRISGPPVFAVASRDAIRREVVRLSALGVSLVALLLLFAYRSLAAVILGFLPVASGALAGVAAVALGHGVVHAITLGFGVTLIGEAVDYSIYLFVQRTVLWQLSVWPTIRLGVLTSICGFAALLPSSFPGLAQLGLYSIAGLEAAALVTRFVLPAWLPAGFAIGNLAPLGVWVERLIAKLAGLRLYILLLPALAAVYLYGHRDSLWSRELAALSTVSTSDQLFDAKLRADAGAPDPRYVVIAAGADREAVLEASEQASAHLAPLVAARVIGGFDAPTRYLPSLALQRERQRSLPPPEELKTRLTAALAGLPVRTERLRPFLHDVESARAMPPLTPEELAGTSLATPVESLLMKGSVGWVALLPLRAVDGDISDSAAARIRGALPEEGEVHIALVDLRAEADRMYSAYLRQAGDLTLAGFVAIVLLLLIALRSPVRMARVVAPLALAVITVAALLVARGAQLSILHIVGMLLIVAVGSNYALFFDHDRERPTHRSTHLTLASLVIANLATVTAFGVLATSRVRVLADLGSTVAPGALLALLFSALIIPARRPQPATAPMPEPVS
jgi:predicted exporter